MNIEYYNANRDIFSPLVDHNGITCGFWMVGQNYRNPSKYYGTYPPSYLKRMKLLFPQEFEKGWILHLFSGMVPGGPRELTLDIKPELNPDFVGNATDIKFIFTDKILPVMVDRSDDLSIEGFDLILADPPYGNNHLKYQTEPFNKAKVVKGCREILAPGGHLVWLDTIMPIWSKADGWRLRGTIGLLQSTNHQVRVISILEKVEPLVAPMPKKKRERYGAVKV